MIRRLTGAMLMGTMLQLTALDVRAECERHAESARQEAPAAGHEHHASHATTPASAPEQSPSRDTGSAPPPRCCMVAGTCGSSAFASIVFADAVDGPMLDAASTSAIRRPASPVQTPEPPPPRA